MWCLDHFLELEVLYQFWGPTSKRNLTVPRAPSPERRRGRWAERLIRPVGFHHLHAGHVSCLEGTSVM